MSVTNAIDEVLLIVLLIVSAYGETNVALGRPAFQSSTFQNLLTGVCVAGRAVDGNIDPNLYAGSCSCTDDLSGGPNWWMVDLGQQMHIKMVVITNRDVAIDSLNYLIVGVTNSAAAPVRGCYSLCGQLPLIGLSGAKNYLKCNPSTASGQYVIVQQPITGPGLMTLCEVEVYAGPVRKTDLWIRDENQRLMTSGRVVLKIRSVTRCILQCLHTGRCESINYRPLDNTCEMNFVRRGASPCDLVTAIGWNWWSQRHDFV